MREAERQILLNVIDRKWREHLYEMDYLKEGVGLRAYAQRNPVVEYQREGYAMFQTMLDGIKEEAVGFLFNVEVQVRQAPSAEGAPRPEAPLAVGQAPVEIRARGLAAAPQPTALQYSAPVIDGAAGTGAVRVEREQDRTAAPALAGGRHRSVLGRRRHDPGRRAGGRPSPVPPGRRQSAPGRS